MSRPPGATDEERKTPARIGRLAAVIGMTGAIVVSAAAGCFLGAIGCIGPESKCNEPGGWNLVLALLIAPVLVYWAVMVFRDTRSTVRHIALSAAAVAVIAFVVNFALERAIT